MYILYYNLKSRVIPSIHYFIEHNYSYTLNNVSFNVLGDTQFSSYVDGVDLFLGVNGSSQFYVPSFGVDQINEIVIEDGYKLFINGGENQEINISGLPVNIGDHPITLNPFTMNLISYLPQDCMPTDAVFAGYEDALLIVKNDDIIDQFRALGHQPSMNFIDVTYIIYYHYYFFHLIKTCY